MSVKPDVIEVNTDQQTLLLGWSDGRQQLLAHDVLRQQCPCGFCRANRLRQKPVKLHAKAAVITAMYDQGYGVQICFDDGHDKGIFPWAYLRDLVL